MDNTMERELEQSGALIVRNAEMLTISTDDDYARAGELLKDIKGKQKAVKDYWREPKAAAQKAHKTLVAREAAMLKPLEAAESVVKRGMLDYTTEREKAAREAVRRETARFEAMAAQAEAQGDADTAELMRDMAGSVPDVASAPGVKGASVRRVWKARVTDPKLVPAYYDGMELRTINMTALNNIAKWRNGEAQIPGVEFYQEASMSVRA